jgi:hypothetical protein
MANDKVIPIAIFDDYEKKIRKFHGTEKKIRKLHGPKW